MKRVAIFASAFYPSLGGVEELVRQQALHLQKLGIQVRIFTNQWPRDLPELEFIDGLRVCRLPFRLPGFGFRSSLSFHASVRRILARLEDDLSDWRPDVIHLQCVSANGWYGAELARRMSVPLVVSSQGERTMDSTGLYDRSPLMNRLLRATLRQAQFITACSEATLTDLETYYGGWSGTPAKVIYNGVGDEMFKSGKPWAHPLPFLLGMGRLVPQKGFDALIQGFARSNLKGVDLLLAGEGSEEASLRQRSSELQMDSRIHFLGRACRERVGQLIRGCAGMIVPSLREPMGIVALEGMATGKPLLLSRVGGLAEISKEGRGCRTVEPGNVEALAEGIRWLGGLRDRDFQENREQAAQFRWERITRNYVEVYQSAVDRLPDKKSPQNEDRENEYSNSVSNQAPQRISTGVLRDKPMALA